MFTSFMRRISRNESLYSYTHSSPHPPPPHLPLMNTQQPRHSRATAGMKLWGVRHGNPFPRGPSDLLLGPVWAQRPPCRISGPRGRKASSILCSNSASFGASAPRPENAAKSFCLHKCEPAVEGERAWRIYRQFGLICSDNGFFSF